MIEENPLSLDTSDIPGVMNWLSRRQAALPLNDDPMLRYCLQLEERIAWQTREIESLRKLLKSEQQRHERAASQAGGDKVFRRLLRGLRTAV